MKLEEAHHQSVINKFISVYIYKGILKLLLKTFWCLKQSLGHLYPSSRRLSFSQRAQIKTVKCLSKEFLFSKNYLNKLTTFQRLKTEETGGGINLLSTLIEGTTTLGR